MNNQIEGFLNEEIERLQTDSGEATELMVPKHIDEGVSILNPADFPDLEEAEIGVSLETKYFEFNTPNMTVRAIFNGIGTMKKRNSTTDELEELPAVYFQTKDGVFLNGGDNLVEQLRHARSGTPIQIIYIGKVKTKSGNNVNKFDIRLLNVKPNPF